jgi:anti-sigma regulatory factor (Ser/Thr protein kinase)
MRRSHPRRNDASKKLLYLPRDAVSVSVTRQVLDGCLETLGVAQETRDDIALALSEAYANVIQHAGPGEEYEVQVSARNSRRAIEVVNVSGRARSDRPCSPSPTTRRARPPSTAAGWRSSTRWSTTCS